MRKQLADLVREMLDKGIELKTAVREFERIYIEEALVRAEGNVSRAAEVLGVHRNTLRSKMDAGKSRAARPARRKLVRRRKQRKG